MLANLLQHRIEQVATPRRAMTNEALVRTRHVRRRLADIRPLGQDQIAVARRSGDRLENLVAPLVAHELKVGQNAKVGALSELFFYSMVMHDVLTDRDHWSFANPVKPIASDIAPADVLRCERIWSRLLTPPLHPLFDPSCAEGERVFNLLNEAAGSRNLAVEFGTLDIRQFLAASNATTSSADAASDGPRQGSLGHAC